MGKITLITGGTGLMALNWAIKTRNEQKIHLLQHQRLISLKGTTSCYFNLGSKDEIRRALLKIKPNLIVHTAGLTNVEKCEADPELAHFTNVLLSANVAEICQELRVKLLYISTDHLSDGSQPYTREDDNINPLNQYAMSKAEAEKSVLEICETALIIRTNIFGWGTSYRKSFSDSIITILRAGKEIQLFNDVYYTPLLISDLVNAIEQLLQVNACGVFNLGASDRISKFEFGQIIASVFGLDETKIQKISINEKLDLVVRPKDMSLSTDKASERLGRTLPLVKDGIQRLKQQEDQGIKKELRAL